MSITACSTGNSVSAQCVSAISARDNYDAEIRRLWAIRSAEISAHNEAIYTKYSECIEAPDTFLRNNLNSAGFEFRTCERYRDFNDITGYDATRGTAATDDNFKKMYMVISNNQSSFTPEEVVEAQLKLRN